MEKSLLSNIANMIQALLSIFKKWPIKKGSSLQNIFAGFLKIGKKFIPISPKLALVSKTSTTEDLQLSTALKFDFF